MSQQSRREFLQAAGVAVGAASLTPSEAVAKGLLPSEYITHLPTALLFSIEDEGERERVLALLEGEFGVDRILTMQSVNFPAPRHDEVLWVQAEDMGPDLVNECKAVFEEAMGGIDPDHGPLIVANFEGDVTSMSRAELEALRETIDMLLETDLPYAPKVV